ncbi:MAG: PP2C family protein-serine/threonine phosphatase [Eubacterium sp.]|nr:PP2C family protein-serine/threonine phosphatase [Eubacterium sp.]
MKLAKMRTSLATNIIGSIVLLMLIFSIIVSTIGYVSFTNAFKREYADTTYHIADTAATLVIADNIDRYLAEGGKSAEYKQTREYLDSYCDKMNVSIVYVIKVDTSDYGRFTSVFNSVGKDTPYTPWEIGYQQDTTNDEYVRIYKDIYENSLKYGTVYRTKDLRGAPPHITTLVPIKDSGGKVVSLMCIQRPMKELDTVRDKYMAKVGFTALGFAVLFALFFASYSRKQFVNPLSKISAEATRFAKENAKGESFEVKSNIHEISALASSIDKMETDMLKYIDNLTSITAEKEKMGAELTIAKTIQENSIPNIFPAFPERAEFDIYASMDPAKEIGGDFYNFFLIDDDHLAFVIGDVSGKGIPAALFMMVTNILVSDRTLMGGTPAEILTFVNNNICDHNKADMFVTLFLAVLEIPTGKIIAANAGHDDAAICKKDGTFELYKTRHNLAVGAMKGVKYKDFEIQLDKGDKLFIYTDGVPEATDKNNSMFTQDRMLRALNENASGTPKDVLKGVRSSVDEFVGDASQFDDLTMLCI